MLTVYRTCHPVPICDTLWYTWFPEQRLTFKSACSGPGLTKTAHDANGNTRPHTTDAEAQADLASAAHPGAHYPFSQPSHPQAFPGRTSHQPTMDAPAVHTRDVAVGSGSEGSQPKRRKRSTVTKSAQARANGYGHYSAYAPQSGYGHHPIHGHYADYEVGPVHGKAKKQAVHRTPKPDDKGPCLNPACRTTGRIPMLFTELAVLVVVVARAVYTCHDRMFSHTTTHRTSSAWVHPHLVGSHRNLPMCQFLHAAVQASMGQFSASAILQPIWDGAGLQPHWC